MTQCASRHCGARSAPPSRFFSCSRFGACPLLLDTCWYVGAVARRRCSLFVPPYLYALYTVPDTSPAVLRPRVADTHSPCSTVTPPARRFRPLPVLPRRLLFHKGTSHFTGITARYIPISIFGSTKKKTAHTHTRQKRSRRGAAPCRHPTAHTLRQRMQYIPKPTEPSQLQTYIL